MKKVIKYSLLITGWIILGVIVLLLLAGLLIQTRPAKNKLATIAENQAEKFIAGNLSIGKINGNFFTGIALEDVLLTYEEDTVAYIGELNINYNLWSLLNNTVDIKSAKIKNPYFCLEQYNDSTWNFQKIVKSGEQSKDSAKSGTMNFVLANFTITAGKISVNSPDTIIPKELNKLNSELSFSIKNDNINFEMQDFSLLAENPHLQLNQLKFELKKDADYFELNNFYIKTAKNTLKGNAQLKMERPVEGSADFETSEFQLNEFEFFIPNFKLAANPLIKLDGDLKQDSAYIQIELKDSSQLIIVNASSANLADFILNKQGVLLDYNVSVELENTKLDHWLGNPELDYELNGNIELAGTGIDPKTAQIQLTGNFSKTVVKGEELREIGLKIRGNSENLDARLSGNGKFGNFSIITEIKNALETPEYSARLKSTNLNLALLTGLDSLYSNLNLSANLKGKGFDPKTLSATAKIEAVNSRFQTVNFDSLFVNASYQNENITANYLRLVTDSVFLVAEGNYSFQTNSDIQAEINFTGLGEFQKYIPVTGLTTAGKIETHFIANQDSKYMTARASLKKSEFRELKLQNLELDAEVRVNKTDTFLNADLQLTNLIAGELTIDSANAILEGNRDSLFIVTKVKSDKIYTSIETGFSPKDRLKFMLLDWQINYKNQLWNLQNPPARIEIDSMNYVLENFKMVSSQTAIPQIISAEGNISRNGEENFKLNLENIDLSRLPEMFDNDFTAKGLFNLNINVGGTADSTLVDGDFTFNNLSYNGYKIANFNGTLDYHEDKANMEITIAPKDSGIFNLKVALPVEFRLDSMNYRLNAEESLNLQLNISKFPLTILKPLNIDKNISGFAEAVITVKGTPETPQLNGKLELDEAAFNNYQFSDFRSNFDFRNNLLNVDAMLIPNDGGNVSLAATLPLQINLDTLDYYFDPKDSISGKALIDSFPLSTLKMLNIAGDISGYLEGNIDLHGTLEAPDPQGEVRLVDASVNIDEYGIEYEDIKLNLNFLKNSVRLDTLLILSDDGKLTGGGKIDFSSGFYKGDVSQSEIQLNFNKFNLLNHNQFNMQITGNTSIGGEKRDVVFDGDLEIPQAEIYLPAVLSMMGRISTPEIPKPILVRQAELMNVSLDSLGIKTFEATKPDSVQFTYFDQLEGQLRIKIPKNTWIKNEDMRIEISGDLELKKNEDFFELFGSVEVVRGQYDLLGKTFVINEGTISFQGGEEVLPGLNINASYSFRNRGSATQKLTVQISGTPESPEINFLLDGSSISEGDALSYILFGKAMDELTISEQQNVEGAGGGSLAREAAASVLSSQITNFLGDKLNVDYIEVKSDGSFDNASVVVGKYITNDLFVSYEQRFGETDEIDVAKYEVKLEYELFRFLFFELNNSSNDSGFDIIIKFDVE